jgi:hypothetical protein
MQKRWMLSLALSLTLSLAATAAAKKAAKIVEAGEIKWTEVPKSNGAQNADMWGNSKKGPHGAFHKFPGGWESPMHTHSATLKIAIVSGTYIYGGADGTKKELPAGSFVEIPGRLKHTSGCKAGGDCVIFTVASGRFDLKMAKGAAPAKGEEKKPEEKKPEEKKSE